MYKRIILLLALIPINVSAAIEASSVTTVTRLISYNQHGGGDVVFRIANPSTNCYGYWIAKNDAGFGANLSLILAARQANTPVKIHGITTERWNGSGNFWCKLYAIEYNE